MRQARGSWSGCGCVMSSPRPGSVGQGRPSAQSGRPSAALVEAWPPWCPRGRTAGVVLLGGSGSAVI